MADDAHMYVRSFAEVSYPVDEVGRAALGQPRRWLDTIYGATDGESFRCDVGPGPHWQEVQKRVKIRLGEPAGGAGRLRIPMTWTATKAGGLFPKLRGTLEISEIQPGTSLIALMAEYRPPLGRVGQLVDNLLLHRLAWATLRTFTDQVAANLGEAVKLDRMVSRTFRSRSSAA